MILSYKVLWKIVNLSIFIYKTKSLLLHSGSDGALLYQGYRIIGSGS